MKFAKINEKKITTYSLAPTKTKKKIEKEHHALPDDNKVKGKLSDKARARLKKALSVVTEAYSFKKKQAKKAGKYYKEQLTFITLTLCATQMHNDYHIRRYMLSPFLDYLTKEKGVKSYIWRAEVQKNGNIHFHILANRNIHWGDIRRKWNSIQKKEGYLLEYSSKYSAMTLQEYLSERNPKNEEARKKAILAYNKGVLEKWQNPNSTDIHQMGKISNTVAYMAKYMSKESTEEDRAIEGHIWGKSDIVDSVSILEVQVTETLEDYFLEVKKDKDNFVVEDKYFSLYWLKKGDFMNYPDRIKKLYQQQQEDNYKILN